MSAIDDFTKRLLDIEQDINDKLTKATSYTLFHSFEARQTAIRGDRTWILIAIALTIVTMIATFALLSGAKTLDVAFFTKLGFTLPAVVAIGFALKQYNKERRLKEEYAFKSAISIALEPYRKLVRDAVENLPPSEHGKFADFLVASISSIFDSPTDKVFGETRIHGATDTKIISSFVKQAKEIVSAFRGA